MPKPEDACGRCGCQRRYHNPGKFYTSSKFRIHGISPSRKDSIEIQAKACCDSCPHCICFCVGFLEPFTGQPYSRCFYEAPDGTHDYHPELDRPFRYETKDNPKAVGAIIPDTGTIPSSVSPVPADPIVFITEPEPESFSLSPSGSTTKRSKKGARSKTTYKRGSPTTELRWEP